MSTTIEWTQRLGTKGETWNPTTGCNKVSQGCKNCYAEVMHKRLQAMLIPKYQKGFSAGVVTHADTLTIPLKWKKPRTVFVNSMSDLFHPDVPFTFIDQVFAVMALTPQHTYQILTKRPERMAEYLNGFRQGANKETANRLLGNRDLQVNYQRFHATVLKMAQGIPLPNVWLGTSVEDQKAADERIPHLMRCPAAVRFLSCEPLLGPVDLRPWLHIASDTDGLTRGFGDINWVIAGGESGHGARPMHPYWARSLRDQCQAAGVPFFFKQWGEWLPNDMTVRHMHRVFIHSERGVFPWDHDARGDKDQGTSKWAAMFRTGKHASGNVLDGSTHLEYPQVG